MLKKTKKWICNMVFSGKKYPNILFGESFTRKELLIMLNGYEKFLVEVFEENVPTLNFIKKKLEQDFLCRDIEIPLFFTELCELQLQYEGYENTLYTDWSHDYAVISHDSTFMTDAEIQKEYNKIDETIKKAEVGLERMTNEIFYFISLWNIA